MVSHTRQHLVPVCRLVKKTGNGHGTRHGTENDEEVLFPFCCGHSRHELHPPVRRLFHQAGTLVCHTSQEPHGRGYGRQPRSLRIQAQRGCCFDRRSRIPRSVGELAMIQMGIVRISPGKRATGFCQTGCKGTGGER